MVVSASILVTFFKQRKTSIEITNINVDNLTPLAQLHPPISSHSLPVVIIVISFLVSIELLECSISIGLIS